MQHRFLALLLAMPLALVGQGVPSAPTGLADLAEPTAATPGARAPWNIRPLVLAGVADCQGADPGQSGGTTRAAGAGFAAALEVWPFRGGAAAVTVAYRYGLSRPLTDQVRIHGEHQLGLGVDLGWKVYGTSEVHLGLEQRGERYVATGMSGTPSSAWVQRAWMRLGWRWSLERWRDLRPFVGLEAGVPLRRERVSTADYAQDLAVLTGGYAPVPQPGVPAIASRDSLARAHTATWELRVSCGVRLFRPRRKWSGPAKGVPQVPVQPTESKEYQLPADAYAPKGEKGRG